MPANDRLAAVRASYSAYESGDRQAIEERLADDFVFYSPPDPGIDRATYFERCWPNAQMIEKFDYVRLTEVGDEVLVTYESTKTDGRRFRNTEIFGFEGNKIARVEVYFGWDVDCLGCAILPWAVRLGVMRRRISFLAVVMLAVGLLFSPAAQAAYPGANGRIAWEGFPAGSGTDSEIVSANADGSGVTALTSNSVNDIDPAWSPDGTKIAFARQNGSVYEIWTMNAGGGGQTLVVQQSKSVTHPTWSPAGNKLVFEYAFSPTDDDIWAADSTGLNSGLAQLATTGLNERDPAWRPGASQLAITKFNTTSGKWDLSFMAYPSGTVTPFLAGAATDYAEPAWSPDGTKLAFQNGVSGVNDNIGKVNADGSGYLGSLPPGAGPTGNNDHNPAWSPEGQLIVWDWDGSGTDTEIRMQRFDGSLSSWITNPGHDRNPDWQPVTTAQVRPQSASPMLLPLTVAFDDCGAGPTHDPPINSSTCGPAQASSPDLTLGEPAVNGKPAKGAGFIRLKTLSPANGEVKVSITDVRCKNYFSGCNTILGDYTSFLNLSLSFQITDRAAQGTAATVPTFILSSQVPCTATADTTVGSTCQVTTNINSILPGAIVPGKRASWVLKDAAVYDTSSHKFLVPGMFYP